MRIWSCPCWISSNAGTPVLMCKTILKGQTSFLLRSLMLDQVCTEALGLPAESSVHVLQILSSSRNGLNSILQHMNSVCDRFESLLPYTSLEEQLKAKLERYNHIYVLWLKYGQRTRHGALIRTQCNYE